MEEAEDDRKWTEFEDGRGPKEVKMRRSVESERARVERNDANYYYYGYFLFPCGSLAPFTAFLDGDRGLYPSCSVYWDWLRIEAGRERRSVSYLLRNI